MNERDGSVKTCATGKIRTQEGSPFAKATEVADKLRYLFEEFHIVPTDIIAKEGPAFNMPFSAIAMGRVHQAIDTVIQDNEHVWNYYEIAPTSLRKFVGASKSKGDTQVKIFKRWGQEFGSTDEAEAFVVAMAGRERHNGGLKTTKEIADEKRALKATLKK